MEAFPHQIFCHVTYFLIAVKNRYLCRLAILNSPLTSAVLSLPIETMAKTEIKGPCFNPIIPPLKKLCILQVRANSLALVQQIMSPKISKGLPSRLFQGLFGCSWPTAQWSHFKRHYLPLFKFLHSHRCSSFCSSLCALLLFSLYFILLLRSFHLSVWCPPTGCFISMCGCVYAHTQTPFSFHS